MHNRAWEKLYDAVRALIIEDGVIQVRLWRAFANGIGNLRLESVPADLRPQFEAIMSSMRGPDGGPGVQRVTEGMNVEQAQEVAAAIFELYEEVRKRKLKAG